MEVKYITHKELRTKLRKVKGYNKAARVMGLDIGRKYTGVALSDKQLIEARPLKTLKMDQM